MTQGGQEHQAPRVWREQPHCNRQRGASPHALVARWTTEPSQASRSAEEGMR